MKYEKPFIDYFSKQITFTSKDAHRFLHSLGSTPEYSKLFMHNLVVDQKLYRIKNGFFTFLKNEAVYGFAFRPFYYGMEYALSIRKIWTQQANPVIITRSKANAGVRVIIGTNVAIRRINSDAFFGFEYLNHMGIFIPVSRPEKILLDFVYYGINVDKITLNNLVANVNFDTLKDYGLRLGNRYLASASKVYHNTLRGEI